MIIVYVSFKALRKFSMINCVVYTHFFSIRQLSAYNIMNETDSSFADNYVPPNIDDTQNICTCCDFQNMYHTLQESYHEAVVSSMKYECRFYTMCKLQDKLQEEFRICQAGSVQKNRELETMKTNLRRAYNDLMQSRAMNKEYQDELVQLKNIIAEHTDNSHDVDKLKEENASKASVLKETKEELEKCRKAHKTSRCRIEELTKEVRNMKTRVTNEKLKYESCMRDFEHMKIGHDKNVQALKNLKNSSRIMEETVKETTNKYNTLLHTITNDSKCHASLQSLNDFMLTPLANYDTEDLTYLHGKLFHYTNDINTSYSLKVVEEISNRHILRVQGLLDIVKNNQQEMTAKEDIHLCVVCQENTRDQLLFPCQHMVTCKQCSVKLETCPICRQNITSSVFVYQ